MTWQMLLERQDGVIARSQALRDGMTPASWRHRFASDRWRLLAPGVAVNHIGTPTAKQFLWAGLLHTGAFAQVSGDAALVEHGFSLMELAALDIAVASARRPAGLVLTGGPAVQVHRTDVPRDRWSTRPEMPVVKVPLAVLHAAAWAPTDRAAEWRIAAVVQQRLTTVPKIRAQLSEMTNLRRRALLLDVLDDVELGAHAASELLFLRFCRSHDLPLPDELQVRVRAGGLRYLDARYRRQRVAFEIDGGHHRDVRHWEADALRSLELAVATRANGERVVRLTGSMLRHDEHRTATLLRQLLL